MIKKAQQCYLVFHETGWLITGNSSFLGLLSERRYRTTLELDNETAQVIKYNKATEIARFSYQKRLEPELDCCT